jgi:hypothetical protein
MMLNFHANICVCRGLNYMQLKFLCQLSVHMPQLEEQRLN